MLDVDVGQRYRVTKRWAGLAGGDFAYHCTILEDRVMTTTSAAAQALEAHEPASAGGAGAVSLEGSECVLADEVAFFGKCDDGTESCGERVSFAGQFVAVERHACFQAQGVAGSQA